jgi:hypothetical protein
MSRKTVLMCSLFLLASIGFSPVYSQNEVKRLDENAETTLTGRLVLDKTNEQERLLLTTKDGQAYLIIGELESKLKESLSNLGNLNLISIKGIKDGRSSVTCEQFNNYVEDKNGEKRLNVEAKCIRYYLFSANEILSTVKSDEQFPEPKRDLDEERRLIDKSLREQSLINKIVGEIYGKITALKIGPNSPIKSVEITNSDQASPIKKVNLVISLDTIIAKKLSEQSEPVALSSKALRVGQEVTAVYSKTELKTEAIYITITKE